MSRPLLALLALLLSWPVWGVASSQPQTVAFSVLKDTTAQLTFEQILDDASQADFIAHSTRSFIGGYTRSAYWFKLDLRPFQTQPSYAEGMWLEIQPPYLDYLDLYFQDDTGQWQHLTAGNKRAYADQLHPYRSGLMVIEGQPDYAYLRLQTHSTSLVILNAWSQDAFFNHARNSYVIFAIALGILLTLLVFNLLQGDWLKNRLYLYFVAYLAIFILALMSVNGLLGQWLLSHHPQLDAMMVPILVMGLLITISLAYSQFLNLSWMRTPVLYGMTLGLTLLGVVGLISVFFDRYIDLISYIGLYVILIYTIWLVKAVLQTFNSEYKLENSLILLATLSGLLGSITMILVLLGWLSVELFGLYLFQMTSFVAIVLFQFVIVLKVRHAMSERQRIEKQHQMVADNLRLTEKIKLEKERFLAMLSHELKTPLSVIQIALEQNLALPNAKQHALMALKDMDQVIERCTHVQRFDDEKTLIKPVAFNPYELIEHTIRYHQASDRIVLNADLAMQQCNWITDAGIFQLVCNNLIDNALKYALKNSLITIELDQTTSGELKMMVHNQIGDYGLPDSDRIFEKYYRSPAAKKVTGSGLGLYLVKGSVAQLGGQISLNTVDHQIVFTLLLPKLAEDNAD